MIPPSPTPPTPYVHTVPVTFVDYFKLDYVPDDGGNEYDYQFYFGFIRENSAATSSDGVSRFSSFFFFFFFFLFTSLSAPLGSGEEGSGAGDGVRQEK